MYPTLAHVALLLTIEKPSNRGVIWDQEIYDNFAYNQDRTFFHSFELEECLAGQIGRASCRERV